jgi:hypothetical protein
MPESWKAPNRRFPVFLVFLPACNFNLAAEEHLIFRFANFRSASQRPSDFIISPSIHAGSIWKRKSCSFFRTLK